jgi:hypothetical protein
MESQYFIWKRKVQIAAGPSKTWALINGTEEIPPLMSAMKQWRTDS